MVLFIILSRHPNISIHPHNSTDIYFSLCLPTFLSICLSISLRCTNAVTSYSAVQLQFSIFPYSLFLNHSCGQQDASSPPPYCRLLGTLRLHVVFIESYQKRIMKNRFGTAEVSFLSLATGQILPRFHSMMTTRPLSF
jgi:hypothetical protein